MLKSLHIGPGPGWFKDILLWWKIDISEGEFDGCGLGAGLNQISASAIWRINPWKTWSGKLTASLSDFSLAVSLLKSPVAI